MGNAIVGNIGHFDNEIDMAGLEGRAVAQPGLRHWSPFVCDVLLFHKPGARAVGPPEELERDAGIQERRLPASEGSGRKGGRAAPSGAGRRDDGSDPGASRLHRRASRGTVQGPQLPLLSSRWKTVWPSSLGSDKLPEAPKARIPRWTPDPAAACLRHS